MALYTKPPKELLLDLIKEANPNLPLPLNATNLSFGIPKTITVTPGSISNTEIVLTARGGSGYVKKVTVKYRRISLDTLFRGLVAEVYKYTAAGPGSYPFDLYGLLKEVNLRFGLNITQDDVTNTWFPWRDDKYYPDRRSSQAVMKAKPESLVWTGETTLRWVSDKKSIADVVLIQEVATRKFPDGSRLITDASKYVLNCETYDANMREFNSDIDNVYNAAVLGSTVAQAVTAQTKLIAAINEVSGKTYTLNQYTSNEPFALGGITPRLFTIPHADLPEANSVDFNRVLVIEYPAAAQWGAGKLFLHYNA